MFNIRDLIDPCVIIGSLFVKLPQIIKIHENWSVDGVNFYMIMFEFISDAIACIYNLRMGYGLLSFFERIVLLAGNFILLLFFVVVNIIPSSNAHRYIYHSVDKREWRMYLFLIVMNIIILPQLIHKKVVPDEVIKFMFESSIGLFIVSRLCQIYTNFKMKLVENLSISMFVLPIIGALARIITAIVDMDSDELIIAGFSSSVILNSIIIWQIWSVKRQQQNRPFHIMTEL